MTVGTLSTDSGELAHAGSEEIAKPRFENQHINSRKIESKPGDFPDFSCSRVAGSSFGVNASEEYVLGHPCKGQ